MRFHRANDQSWDFSLTTDLSREWIEDPQGTLQASGDVGLECALARQWPAMTTECVFSCQARVDVYLDEAAFAVNRSCWRESVRVRTELDFTVTFQDASMTFVVGHELESEESFLALCGAWRF